MPPTRTVVPLGPASKEAVVVAVAAGTVARAAATKEVEVVVAVATREVEAAAVTGVTAATLVSTE